MNGEVELSGMSRRCLKHYVLGSIKKKKIVIAKKNFLIKIVITSEELRASSA